MNYIYNSLPYDITRRIRQNVVSQDDANDTKDSFYVIQGNRKIEIRVSNHCTHLWTWHEHKNGKFDDVTRISIVFEDKDTYNDINLVLKKYRDTPLKVMEFVYRIENPQTITSQDVKLVINQIKKCIKNGEMFADPTGKLTYSKEGISINPTTPSNNKENLNCNRNMKRTNKIRLTESQLHQVIKESVKKVMKETDEKHLEYGDTDNLIDMINNKQFNTFGELASFLKQYGFEYTFTNDKNMHWFNDYENDVSFGTSGEHDFDREGNPLGGIHNIGRLPNGEPMTNNNCYSFYNKRLKGGRPSDDVKLPPLPHFPTRKEKMEKLGGRILPPRNYHR